MRLRRMRLYGLQFLVFTAAAASMAAAAQHAGEAARQAPVLRLEGFGRGAADLDGPWQFHLGDDPAWAAPEFDDSGWEQLSADQPWGAQGHEGYCGFAWYRRHVTIGGGAGGGPDYALLINNVDDAYELYWNGVAVGHFGKLPPGPVLYFDQPAQTYGLGKARSGVLAVRVWMPALMSSDPDTGGGFETMPVLGTAEAIAARKAADDYAWMRRLQFGFGMNSLYVLAGLVSLLVWLRDRSQWMLFWMAGFCFYPPLNLLMLQLRLPWPANIAFGVMQLVYALGDVALWYLLLWLLELHENRGLARLVRVASICILTVSGLDGLVAGFGWLSPWTLFMQISDAILSTVVLLLFPVSIVLIGFALAQHRSLNAVRWVVALSAFVDEMMTEIGNAASQGIRFTHWTLSDHIQGRVFQVNGSTLSIIQVANVLLFVALVYAVYRNQTENRRRQRLLEEEFKNARELQQVLIPETLPSVPGFTLTSAYHPALEVGGDFFQILPIGDDATLIVLGDVSGKGLKAAMTVSMIVGAIRTLAEVTTSPAEMLAGLNRRLYGRMQGGFATCIALLLDADGGCLIASAGHPAPFLNERELDLPGTLPLGLTPSTVFEEVEFRIGAGDHVAVFTDGLLEARGAGGELFGFERLQSLFATRPSAEQASDAAVSFGQDDDITILTLTRLMTAAVAGS